MSEEVTLEKLQSEELSLLTNIGQMVAEFFSLFNDPLLISLQYYRDGAFPDGSDGKELAYQGRRHRFEPFHCMRGKIPWRRKIATYFSISAWRIPWTEEPGRLQSMGLQKSWT